MYTIAHGILCKIYTYSVLPNENDIVKINNNNNNNNTNADRVSMVERTAATDDVQDWFTRKSNYARP